MSINKAIKHLKEIRITRIKIPGKSEPLENIDKMSQTAKKLYDALNLGRYFKTN